MGSVLDIPDWNPTFAYGEGTMTTKYIKGVCKHVLGEEKEIRILSRKMFRMFVKPDDHFMYDEMTVCALTSSIMDYMNFSTISFIDFKNHRGLIQYKA